MTGYWWVALGGALGACGRLWVSAWVQRMAGTDFPMGTLAVNLIGSFLFGVLFILVFSLSSLREPARLFLLVGGMGAFTTFSTFSFETIRLLENSMLGLALLNVLVNTVFCCVGLWVGMLLGRQLF